MLTLFGCQLKGVCSKYCPQNEFDNSNDKSTPHKGKINNDHDDLGLIQADLFPVFYTGRIPQ